MIKNKNISWHYDACIEMWNEIAEEGYHQKSKTKIYKKYKPVSACFACELFIDADDCKLCPFTIFGPSREPCHLESSSPYFLWEKSKAKENAIEIAQLFIDSHPDNKDGENK